MRTTVALSSPAAQSRSKYGGVVELNLDVQVGGRHEGEIYINRQGPQPQKRLVDRRQSALAFLFSFRAEGMKFMKTAKT